MEQFKFNINYENCLTNLSSSIRKYFNLPYYHKTIPLIDKILEEKKPENLIVMLFDGMGSRIIKKNLPENSFLIKKQITEITSVFPPTTTAATTSLETGLNPIEHGWLGWTMYINPLNNVYTLFWNSKMGEKEVDESFIKIKENYLNPKRIVDELNENEICESYLLSPHCDENKKCNIKYQKLNNIFETLEELISKKGKKYIYVYNNEPDHTMHSKGCYSSEAIKEIKKINNSIEKFSQKINSDNTLIIVTADHGHLTNENVILCEEISHLMERNLSIEGRACSFKIKKGKEEKFKNKFNLYYGNDFHLFSKDEVIKNQFFGDGNMNFLYESAIGDFLAISKNKKNLIEPNDILLKSGHGGISDDESYIPIIII